MKKYIKIRVKGIVQGVGFRPFVYRIAREQHLTGSVVNDTEGVLIIASGEPDNVDVFLKLIKENSPPLSYVQDVIAEEILPFESDEFTIGESKTLDKRSTFIAPDTALCNDCLQEFLNSDNRRYHYPFITCTNCGPRFSIVNDIPYDRKNTAMSGFQMCSECDAEYKQPLDRRFHTQPNACMVCGPALALNTNERNLVSDDNEFIANECVTQILSGRIIAIKGVGGYLLAADARSDTALEVLRQRKCRPFKPFALMAGNIESIEDFLHVSEPERSLLLAKERPIVLLKEKKRIISKLVAPSLSYIGIMLPYMPFQHHLFSINKNMILVMTSGNISDEPIIFKDDEAFQKLAGIADYFITFNRDISCQSDDSVLFVENGSNYFIRRSRGFVPVPFRSSNAEKHLFATGGDLKSSFALAKDDIIVLSQHLGDLASPSGNELYRNTAEHFKRVYDFSPDTVISDLHPGYFTTLYANELEQAGLKSIKIQHHHAHIAGVLEEFNIDEKVIGIAYDGTGYGTDGTLWGSEFLIADRLNFKRAAHFSNFPLPGGESAIKDVWKIGISLLHESFGKDFPIMKKSSKTDIILEIIEKKLNSPATCSIGRIFDGISAILGISETISTEAEAAMLLEEAAWRADKNSSYKGYEISSHNSGDELIINTGDLTEYIVSLIKKNETVENIAFKFHSSVSATTIKVAALLREKYNINKIALSGGVFQNRLLLNRIFEGLMDKSFEVYTHHKVPSNDGCIALGQIVIGKEIINNG